MFDEDLFEISTSCVEIKNREVVRDFNFEIMKSMKIANDSLAEQLAKYKRAFEILKDFNDLPPLEKFIYCKEENYYYAEIEEYDDNLETYKTLIYTLGKEEYELLEELMKND